MITLNSSIYSFTTNGHHGDHMKLTFAVLALTLSLSSTVFAAEGLVLSIKTHEVLTLKKVSKTKFEKISQVATGTASFDHITAKGSKNLMSQAINEADDQNVVSLEVTGKNILRVTDAKEAINKEIPAVINTSLFGSIKKIKVTSATMQGLYAASMKKSGLDVFKKLRLFGGALTSSIISSDMDCEADGDLLICQQDATLVLAAE